MAPNELNFGDESESDDNFNPAPADMSEEEDKVPRVKSSKRDRDAVAVRDDGHADEDRDDEDARPSRSAKRSRPDDEEEEKPDEEENEENSHGDNDGEDDEDDEDDEEEEEEDVHQGHRRKRRRAPGQNFFDIEAEVDDEDEAEDEERDGEEIEDFIDNAHPDDLAESGALNDDRRHRELDRQRELDAGIDAEKQADIFRERYGKRATARTLGDSAVVPRRLLLPSVQDPSIWAVRCKEGKEREVILSIQKKTEERVGTSTELRITSAFERGGPNSVMKGYIYVEARSQQDVLAALDGVFNVYPRSKLELVSIKDMPDLLRVVKTPTIEPGAWVRLRKPAKHAGDLAQVIDVTENGLEARVRFIPRLDFSHRDDGPLAADGKRKRPGLPGPRPPAMLFNENEARRKGNKPVTRIPGTAGWSYNGEEFESGFQLKDIKIQALQVRDINATLDEITRFARSSEDGTENLDLKALASSLKDSNASRTHVPGDIIEVYQGEQQGVVGKAINVQGDIVTLKVVEGGIVGQVIEVPCKGLRKRFRAGDHVKVTGGQHRDEVGMVVEIVEDRVTVLTDQNTTEIAVFSKDLREASDIGGQGSLGQFTLLDLVQLDPTTVGCIIKIDRETLTVLDQTGETRTVLPSQIPNKLPKRRTAVAADRNGSEIRLDDVVREYGGQQRQGKIIHMHRSFIYLHSNAIKEHAGVFVTRASNVNTVAAKGGRVTANAGPDLSVMNPALKRNPRGSSMPPPRVMGFDRAINQTVTIRKGGYKGLLGIVKDTTDTHARVELHTKSKIVTVLKADLTFKDRLTGRAIDIHKTRPGRGGHVGNGGGGGGATDRWSGGRTTMGSGDRTPAWGVLRAQQSTARTPAWSRSDAAGARTPAWGDGSRTVHPYDGSRTSYGGATSYGSDSRTPAWCSGAKTPAPDAFGHGSKTPAYDGGGGDSWGSKTPGYDMSAPTPGGDAWGYTPSAGAYDAPTPGAGLSAPTPGAFNAPTPGAYSAPTPGFGAPTPAAYQGGWADTPAASAPTPAPSGEYYGAPTPAAYGSAPTPAATEPSYADDDE